MHGNVIEVVVDASVRSRNARVSKKSFFPGCGSFRESLRDTGLSRLRARACPSRSLSPRKRHRER